MTTRDRHELANALRFICRYGYRAPIICRVSGVSSDGDVRLVVNDRAVARSSLDVARALNGYGLNVGHDGLAEELRERVAPGKLIAVYAGSLAIHRLLEMRLIDPDEADEIIEAHDDD